MVMVVMEFLLPLGRAGVETASLSMLLLRSGISLFVVIHSAGFYFRFFVGARLGWNAGWVFVQIQRWKREPEGYDSRCLL
jgi:hypothetical protein